MEASRYKRILARISLAGTILMLSGCNSALLDPKGSIGVQEKELIITALLLMLIVVIPVILMTIYFAYRYRESNTGEEYAPEWAHSTKIEVVVWTIPIIIIAILATITWRSTHELEHPSPSQVTSNPSPLRWCHSTGNGCSSPEENIATVNYVAFPKDVPVQFKLTSDNIMNAFFIPRLGTQIYAMPGMVTKLNLIANHTGDYKGFASNYSGKGFSQMKFTAAAMEDRTAFLNWVQQVKASPDRIEDWEQFRALASPTVAEPVKMFSSIPPFLFTDVVTQHPGSMNCLPENLG
ncbi:LOW QUALITY PROTEIN: cytochrome O ubiquinol oxidase subunit II [Vibrio sp. JCM 19052]|nr:LOW QUALITY PROTEIN: cytochrome O ubiquinol oxidase subunit II [Vibrio sp. JCM 19052]